MLVRWLQDIATIVAKIHARLAQLLDTDEPHPYTAAVYLQLLLIAATPFVMFIWVFPWLERQRAALSEWCWNWACGRPPLVHLGLGGTLLVSIAVSVDEHGEAQAVTLTYRGPDDEPLYDRTFNTTRLLEVFRVVRALDSALCTADTQTVILAVNDLRHLEALGGLYRRITHRSLLEMAERAHAVVVHGASVATGAIAMVEPGCPLLGAEAALRLFKIFSAPSVECYYRFVNGISTRRYARALPDRAAERAQNRTPSAAPDAVRSSRATPIIPPPRA